MRQKWLRARYKPQHLRRSPYARRIAIACAQLALVSVLTALATTSPANAATITTTAVASGGPTSCAIRTGGVAYCWGDNRFGQLGNGTTTSSTTPVLVSGNYTWASISTMFETFGGGNATTCGVTTSGAGYCWGQNGSGELGDGTTTERTVPTLVAGSHTWSSITVGWIDTCGITTAGAAYCWGNDSAGEGGNGGTAQDNSPTLVSGGYTWASLSLGDMGTCGVTTTHVGYCWGANWAGEVGNGNATQQNSPTLVSGGYSWANISTGASTSCGVTTTGVGYCWGGNTSYEYGDGNTTSNSTPTAVSGGYTWSSITVGSYTACGVTTANVAYCWGFNDVGQVGNGNTTTQTTPAAVSGGLSFSSIQVSNSYYNTNTDVVCGLTTGGVAYCWGYNNEGQVGDRTTINRSAPTAVNWVNVGTYSLIASGGQTVCAIRTGGIAYCWGDNTYGQLGNGTTTSSPYPQQVLGGYVWKSIDSQYDSGDGDAFTCGLTTSGSAYCWGYNGHGALGNGTTTNSYVPTLVSGGYTWASISVGYEDVCGVTTSGTGYCWGYNNTGQVGDGTTTQRTSPTAVSGGYTFSQLNAGWGEACGVTTTGTGYCWGYNLHGNVGNNATGEVNSPTLVNGSYTWSNIMPGEYDTCGVTTAGAGYCWGYNTSGEDGDNTTTEHHVPTAVNGSYTWSTIQMGADTACGLTTAGVGYCWGYNVVGQVGNGNTTDQHVPAAVSGGYTFSAIESGADFTADTGCGLTTGGQLYCWGGNNKYQVGDETTTNRSVPTAVVWPSGNTPTQVASGGLTNCAVVSGNAYCWGDNTYGQIGDGTTIARTSPTLVLGGYTWKSISTTADIGDGDAITCGVTVSGTGYCWGVNADGEIGDGTNTDRHTPTLISGGYTWASIAVGAYDVCGVTTAGAGYCWGYNVNGEDGNNTTVSNTTPTLISGGHTWSAITAGWGNTCGVTTAGAGYCWGDNAEGEVGDNTITERNIPTAVSGAYTWAQISTAWDDTCGVTTTGVAYCWGLNASGEVGDNTQTERNVPTAPSTTNTGAVTWSSVLEGDDHTCGITTTGAVWCWGLNSKGQLGTNNTTSYSIPTAVNGSQVFTSISANQNVTCGIAVTGVLYCWGYNNKYQVGDGTTTNRKVPTAVLWDKATSQIAPGGQTNCAIKAGKAYCWGNNTYGQIGDNTTTARTSPTLVSGGYTWTSISSQYNSNGTDDVAITCGIITTGAAYCWGANGHGAVGDGTTTDRHVPTLVSGGYTWASISVGWMDVCGVTTAGVGYCWGYNSHGQDGDNTTTQHASPTAVSGGYTWASINAGWDGACGVTTAGAGYCWGENDEGEVGNNSITDVHVPTAVNGGYVWSSIKWGGDDTCGVTISGAGYCWGLNEYGENGNGNTGTQHNAPVAVSGGYTWTSIVPGDVTACGLTTSGASYCWGYNGAGEVGDGTTTNRNTPTAVNGGLTFSSIWVGADKAIDDTSCAITPGGTEYCWGGNNVDQVGDGTTASRYTPTPVVWPGTPEPPSPVSSIGPGGQTNCAIKSGNAYCWGDNTYGQIGDGTTTSHNVPTLVAGNYQWASISTRDDTYATDDVATTCGVTLTGAGYCWGANTYGNVGDGTTTQRTTPTPVAGGYTWASITPGYLDTCGLTTSGAAYCWGRNQYGEDGVNTTTENNSPVLVSGGYTWKSIATGWGTECGITTSNVPYCWGYNADSEVGDNSTTNRMVPTAVSGGLSLAQISPGSYDTCGVTTTGSGYCWGSNANGEDGNNTITANPTPVAVNGGLTWSSISEGDHTTCGVTTINAGYCWGVNTDGQVGDATTTQRKVPTALSGKLAFSSIVNGMDGTGTNDTNCGITTAGVEFCWGYNNSSQVGDQTTTNRNVPTPVDWNNATPNPPTSLAQYQSDGITALSIGGYSTSAAVLKATVSDPDPAMTGSLCVELIPSANSFRNVATYCGSPVNSGNTATVTAFGLVNATSYKWQAQTVNSAGLASPWVSFNSGSASFTADTLAPTTGTVYDGASAGVESAFNNGSLSQLSCNWSGYSDSGSGLASYDYSFGTSPGDTSILGWTNVASSTTLVNVSSLTLHTSQVYYCNVRAHDVAGNVSSTVSSSGQMVAPTLTFTTSTNSITFAGLSAGNGYTNTQTLTLTTSTNAYSGYVVSVSEASALTSGSNTIADYTSPASAPTTWSGTGFGYTISGGAASGLFAGSKYAHFGSTASPDTPVSHSGPITGTGISSEQETVTLKVAGASSTRAGSYSTQLRFSCVATY